MKKSEQIERQIKKGVEVESEHENLYLFIKENGLPTAEQFYKAIALTHLKESIDYYDKLERAGL